MEALIQTHLLHLRSITLATRWDSIVPPYDDAAVDNSHRILLSLLSHTPHLRSLALHIGTPSWIETDDELSAASRIFTTRLIELTSHLASACPAIESLSISPSTLEIDRRLRVTSAEIVFSHLGSLPHLHTLWLGLVSLFRGMKAEHYTQLHSFPSLTSLVLPRFTRRADQPTSLDLLELLTPEAELTNFASLQNNNNNNNNSSGRSRAALTHLPISYGLPELLLASLPLCRRWAPSLESLNVSACLGVRVQPFDSRCLASFTNLRELEIASLEPSATNSFISAFEHIQQLKKLRIASVALTLAQVSTIVASQARLASLTLIDITTLDSLAFLRLMPHRSCVWLKIEYFDERSAIAPNEIFHFTECVWPRLEHLELSGAFFSSINRSFMDQFKWKMPSYDHERYPYLRKVVDSIYDW